MLSVNRDAEAPKHPLPVACQASSLLEQYTGQQDQHQSLCFCHQYVLYSRLPAPSKLAKAALLWFHQDAGSNALNKTCAKDAGPRSF